MPRSASGWLRWAAYILEAQASPHCSRHDWSPRSDFRMRDSRETALSIKRALERVDDGGGAAGLLFRFYVEEASWWSFQEREQRIISKTAQAFAQELRRGGFLTASGEG